MMNCLMFGYKDLKTKINKTSETIECPVKDCNQLIPRMKKGDSHNNPEFICPTCNITVTPSTFIYSDMLNNLLWKDQEDLAILEDIKKVKRVLYHLKHEKSEDALTWNVFRYLEKNGLIERFLSMVIGQDIKNASLIYWSYSQNENSSWSILNGARKESRICYLKYL